MAAETRAKDGVNTVEFVQADFKVEVRPHQAPLLPCRLQFVSLDII